MNDNFRGRLSSTGDIHNYLTAGRGTMTVVSKASGARFTYKLKRAPDKLKLEVAEQERPIFVSVLTGPDNEADYKFLGTIRQVNQSSMLTYAYSYKSKISISSLSAIAFKWLIKAYNEFPDKLLEEAEIWHEGRCGRCGRKLTVPSSIQRGFGPECIGRMS